MPRTQLSCVLLPRFSPEADSSPAQDRFRCRTVPNHPGPKRCLRQPATTGHDFEILLLDRVVLLLVVDDKHPVVFVILLPAGWQARHIAAVEIDLWVRDPAEIDEGWQQVDVGP